MRLRGDATLPAKSYNILEKVSGNTNEERQGQRFFLIKLGRVNKAAASWSISACTLPAPALQSLSWPLHSTRAAGRRDEGPGPGRVGGCSRSIPRAPTQSRCCTTKNINNNRKKKKKEPSNLNIFEKKKRNPLWPQNARGHVLSWQPAETSPICTILQRMCRELSSQPRLVCLQDCNKPHSKLSCKISIGFTVQISLSDNGVS